MDSLMRLVIRVADFVELARKFEDSPAAAMQEVVTQMRSGVKDVLERAMDAEIEVFLGQPQESENKRNGFASRTYGIKGVGSLTLRVPRDRAGRFSSNVVPANRRYDEALEKDLALLSLAGLSTRTLAQVSNKLLGIAISATEVSNAMRTVVPAAKAFLTRPLGGQRFVYLYVDGTNFRIRRSTVAKEPTLVVLGVDEKGHKSVLSMVQGDKDNRRAWEAVFVDLKERGLCPEAVQLGIMDGLPGLGDAFREAFPNARAARCWVHKARNVFPRVPRRYQEAFKSDWDAIAYAESKEAARAAFDALVARWSKTARDAVACLERDLDALLVHYEFPKEHWGALRTTNPIERINKEFKRRSKAMEVVGPDGLHTLLAFTALRLEIGWTHATISTHETLGLEQRRQTRRLEEVEKALLQ
jgi:putative transposase